MNVALLMAKSTKLKAGNLSLTKQKNQSSIHTQAPIYRMKKIATFLTIITVTVLFLSSCKSHGGCAAYSKADAPVSKAKSI